MRAARLVTVATLVLVVCWYAPAAKAQVIFSTGEGVCKKCGHSELDTQRYINSFLNQMFFPPKVVNRTAVAASLYLLTATYTMYGRLSPDPQYSSVTISITAEVKNAIPTGSYHVKAVTPSGKIVKDTYPIGKEPFSVNDPYAPGARRVSSGGGVSAGGPGNTGPGGRRRSGPIGWTTSHSRRSAKCSRSRVVKRGNETIVYCSVD